MNIDSRQIIPSKEQCQYEGKTTKEQTQQDLRVGKSVFCRYYRQGCCLFTAKDCKYAHDVKDIRFRRLDLEEYRRQKNCQKPVIVYNHIDEAEHDENAGIENQENEQNDIKSAHEEANYKDLHELQFRLKEREDIQKIYTQAEINRDRRIRRELRDILHRELQQDFLDLLYREYKTKSLERKFIEKCFLSVQWIARWKYLLSTTYAYKTKIAGHGVNITRRLEGKDYDEYMETCIIRIIKDLRLIDRVPISPVTITNFYYQHLAHLDPSLPPHRVYLKYREMKSMDEYLDNLQKSEAFRVKLAKACGVLLKEIAGVQLFDRVSNEVRCLVASIRYVLLDMIQKSHIGFVSFFQYESEVMRLCRQEIKQFSNNVGQIKKLMMKIPLQENFFIISLNSELYLFSLERFKAIHIPPQIQTNNCSFVFSEDIVLNPSEIMEEDVSREVSNRQTEEFLQEEINLEKIVLVDNEETLKYSDEHIADIETVGIDIEGILKKNGRLELIQCSAGDKIFIFDVYGTKKAAIKDQKNALLYRNMCSFLKNLMEDPKLCKVFHDGRKDSLALHLFLDTCPTNVFDLSSVEILIRHLEHYLAQNKKEKNIWGQSKEETKSAEEAMQESNEHVYPLNHEEDLEGKQLKRVLDLIQEIKLPNLNEVLEKYQAKSGPNRLKNIMKNRFDFSPKEYFLYRPIDPEYLIYAAKDVEGLIEVKTEMEHKLKIMLEGSVGADINHEKLSLLCRAVSKVYMQSGCHENEMIRKESQ